MLEPAKTRLQRLRKLLAGKAEDAYVDRDEAGDDSQAAAYADGQAQAYGDAEQDVRKEEQSEDE